MTGKPVTIIQTNEQFSQSFQSLDHRSIVNCRLRLNAGEEHLLVDLLARGVTLIPSATAQLASRSKVHQARIFSDVMLPHTRVAYNDNDLLSTISDYNSAGIGEVVVKRDRKNGGLGIHRFETIEKVYNLAIFSNMDYPLVIQPFVEEFKDLRILYLGAYQEAYERVNQDNFRHNLHCGGTAIPYTLDIDLLQFCNMVMTRGGFPYAHLDLMLTPSGETFLTEINLRGGLRGAQIDAGDYQDIIRKLQEEELASRKASLQA